MTHIRATAVAATTAETVAGGTPMLTYPPEAPSRSTMPINVDAINAAGAAIASPIGSQNSPVTAESAASGIARAASGAAIMLAGTLISETVPNVGNSSGSVAI
jgi:hypothetical protein